ncbi:hypothetical protein COCNU_10G001130 [Cocos nucifera]|uniref:HVA22-like protein n=1 Tax=Cocos nucifera TaxID=13894 RepID=A0A8K0ILM0_COCNU|nr:hypothetical protein COCNU_10G001130 [Cocos nucifera]
MTSDPRSINQTAFIQSPNHILYLQTSAVYPLAQPLVLGYVYPAYECFKTVELNKPEVEQLRFWCQYWILVAALTIFERVGESFISWLPMYNEAKLAFFIYLWYPKTKGTTYVYETFLQPYVAKHENEIDRNLLELRTRAGDVVVLYWQKAASYGQTRNDIDNVIKWSEGSNEMTLLRSSRKGSLSSIPKLQIKLNGH